MESEFSPDKEKSIPPVPIKTYQWEDLRRAREVGAYPWTHLLKTPLEGEITAEDIIRETTPRRSMSREVSKSRTHSPVDRDVQRILNLDSSPGSSRKHGEEGEDEGVHIPNFSKEVSLDSEEDNINQAVKAYMVKSPDNQPSSTQTHLATPIEIPKNVSPKGILKRRVPEQQYSIGVTEVREKTKCCHPLVNKIKHLADKTLHKLEKMDSEKSPVAKRKKNQEDGQEIRQLRSSPGAVRRQKFSAIKLGDSDEMSKTMSVDTPPPRKKKEHIYEDIEESKHAEPEKSLQFSPNVEERNFDREDDGKSNKENESISEKKSVSSYDPSLVADDTTSLKPEEHIMEKLHKKDNTNNEAVLLDEEMDPEEPNVDEIFQNQLEETRPKNDSPNITITEIIDEDIEVTIEQTTTIPIESSPSPSPLGNKENRNDVVFEREWSKPSSDHEYEIIEKPNMVYTAPSVDEKPALVKTDDELSSTTSLERKYLQHASDEEEQPEEKENIHDIRNDEILSAEALQKDIEDRYFVNTPSTVSRTECEVSTSQVDSSALENLPLKRDSRSKNNESTESKIQQRIKEGTGKLKSQADKLKTKLQSIKSKQFSMPEKARINFPDRPKFKMPERPKISLPDRPKFTLPDRRKFSLPDRPKFKKINISEKLTIKDRKKFTLPDRPKFNVPDLPKFKMPERPKINFPSLGRKKEYKVDTDTTELSSNSQNVATVDFEAKTFPRLFNRKKKAEIQKTSSSPTLNRDDTPPPTFTFTRMKKSKEEPSSYIPDSPEQPREYGNIDHDDENLASEVQPRKQFETTYDFDKMDTEYLDEEPEPSDFNENRNISSSSIPNISPSNQEYSHVINEIDNDEFFVRPRGISRENIQVREYLSDEIRQAFKIPKNVLAMMGSNTGVNNEHEHVYDNEPEADPELMVDENDQMRYSTEDLNDKDDGYYTFPPVRPSRAKRKKKETESIKYIDDSVNASIQFSEVDLGLTEDQHDDQMFTHEVDDHRIEEDTLDRMVFPPPADLHSIHEYANDDVIEYPENVPIQSQTLPMPPRRKKKFGKKDMKHSSFNDFSEIPPSELWEEPHDRTDDIIVYRTEHEYIVPPSETVATQRSPVPPRRNRSRSSRSSFCDDDRTSHGAESLTLDTHIPHIEEIEAEREIRQESPGYATVDKGPNAPSKGIRRSLSKTPPARRRKSNSSERKYYTVGSTKSIPDRPPRKKSSTSLMTLDSFSKRSISGDFTQYVEIDEPQVEEVHKDLKSGEVLSKMKDRPLPPPPRPPRGPRRKKRSKDNTEDDILAAQSVSTTELSSMPLEESRPEDVVEIEVSTQTDPLPDDVDYELGMDENLDISMSSSLRDIVDEESILGKSHSKIVESPRFSRPTSRSEKSFKFSDPKLSELAKANIGRTSPTVILVERRVSSPTRINEREEMLTEASLTVQHIDIDETQIPDVPPLPRSRGVTSPIQKSKAIPLPNDERALERVTDTSRDIQLDNLVTQRLQVRDLDVGRLNVSELQASKILVSDIEGMTLQVTELDSKSGHISVSGIEFSQSVIDEIVKKFAEITTSQAPPPAPPVPPPSVDHVECPRPVSREEETQTDAPPEVPPEPKVEEKRVAEEDQAHAPPPPPRPIIEEISTPPQRPPPPDLTPLLYSYLQDINITPGTFYPPRQFRERPMSEHHDSQHQSPPPPTRRAKRKPAAPHSESSSDDGKPRPSPRRMGPPVRAHEPTITEAGAQFFRVCQTSISRTIRNMFNSLMTYISGTEDKKDVQMALVIFLVLIAGLIMFGLSDSRTIHHHHWEFFNPPDGKP
ncbi:titin isoform X1 [Ostrinia furnacalis]|uniref:titin isoform X1 n=2 Tax=Ostrinia furnacalis TaxID=93504 RepID=UPI00103B7AAD|nr:titin isoform X1 [Ostrinia furnacalis]